MISHADFATVLSKGAAPVLRVDKKTIDDALAAVREFWQACCEHVGHGSWEFTMFGGPPTDAGALIRRLKRLDGPQSGGG